MVIEKFAPGFEHIVPSDAAMEKIAGGFIFTEGPVWNGREENLVWVDIIGDTIYKWTPGQGQEVLIRPSGHANGTTLDSQGRLLVAGWSERTVWRLEHDGSIVTLASHYQGQKLNTPNDIVVKSDGSIYFTDPSGGLNLVGHQGQDLQKYLDCEGIYRIDPNDLTLTRVIEDFESPNGLCFSPDESLLYVNDTRRRHIRVFEVQSDGTLRNGRLFAELIGDDLGIPDGMKVDVEGNVYCTGPGGVWVMDPQGNPLGRIKVPEDSANFGWGGSDWSSLYITARTSVYRMKLNIPGVPVYPTG